MTVPETLDLFIGGYMGTSYWITWKPPELVYRVRSYGDRPWRRKKLQPGTGDWQRFWLDLHRIGVWRWAPDYEPDGIVCDGTGWTIEIQHDGEAIKSNGNNAYPAGFDRFRRAVSRLVGGKPFE